MLQLDQTVLVIVDVQGKLAQLMHARERLVENLGRLMRGAQALAVPLLVTEQNPTRMGPTIPELGSLLGDLHPIAKMSFGCAEEPAFMQALESLGRRHVLVAGIETHVCVFQTAAQLQPRGFGVQVVADAVSSRTESNYRFGLERIRNAGVPLTTVESALFELLGTADHPAFRTVLGLVK